MNRVSINENPDPWRKETDNTLKIISLNCAGLKAHFQDIQTDDRMKKADIIHLVETHSQKKKMNMHSPWMDISRNSLKMEMEKELPHTIIKTKSDLMKKSRLTSFRLQKSSIQL